MTQLINELFADKEPSKESIDSFIEAHEFPLVEPGRVTFVYRGAGDEVILRRWISGHSTARPMTRMGQSDLWALTMALPDLSRFEYKFEVVSQGNRHLILDELNDVLAHDPFGANSVCQGFGYERPDWTFNDEESRSGTVEDYRFHSPAFGEERDIQVYLPARFRPSRQYPLLIVHDGSDFVRFAELKTVLDNLIHRLEVPPMIVALTNSADRLGEYTCNDKHAQFLAEDLLGFMESSFPLMGEPTARAVMGASLGAVASFHAAAKYPDKFGRLLLQSGTFLFTDLGRNNKGEALDPIVSFINKYRSDPWKIAERIYVSCGVYESLIYENRSLIPVLQSQETLINFEEARDAHNWENWRDRLRSGLTWLLPGPLWMVYE
ncbi:MAG TPA: alpha/beta hydrolase-fold protein [Xanthomonadales bacterium]|nr:alpha/beta hydrolase-fold protein [Xanthomonadales bacterium]